MRVETSCHQGGRWSAPIPAGLASEQTLVIAFGAPAFADHPRPFAELRAAFPGSCIVGCSTSGEILGRRLLDDTVSVGVIRFERSRLRQASAPARSAAESASAGRDIGRTLAAADLRAVLVFSDGLTVNGTELVRGLSEVLPPSVVVTGGLAGDGPRFERTWVLQDGAPTSGVVSAVGLYGDGLRVGHGSRGGWDMFGIERVVTRAQGNVLYELDGRSALNLYKEYLGERAAGLPATALLFPLSLRSAAGGTDHVVRTVLAVDHAEQSLTFAGDIPQGSRAQLMKANFDRLIQGASDAALMTRHGDDGGETLTIAVSCVGRRLVLGERTEEEIEATLDALPEATQQIGFYSYGEISPHASGTCDLHNQTMTLTVIGEVP